MGAMVKRLKSYRAEQGKTQFEMGMEMGISVEEISLIERGKKEDNLKL